MSRVGRCRSWGEVSTQFQVHMGLLLADQTQLSGAWRRRSSRTLFAAAAAAAAAFAFSYSGHLQENAAANETLDSQGPDAGMLFLPVAFAVPSVKSVTYGTSRCGREQSAAP